jgi:hypothetical protein
MGILRFKTDMKAIIKKATPPQNRLPLRNQTTRAIMTAGKKKSRTLAISMIMMMPMSTRNNSAMSSNGRGKLGRANKESHG